MWAEFAMFIKSKIFRKIWKEASLVKDNIITEEGLYAIHIAVSGEDEDLSTTMYLRFGCQQIVYFRGGVYVLDYTSFGDVPTFALHYHDLSPVEAYTMTIYRLL